LLLGALGCSDVTPGNGGDQVKPKVVEPPLEKVKIEQPGFTRPAVVRVALKEPQALPALQSDRFRQSDGIVDILWVIDDSGSMDNQRNLLVTNFHRFFNELASTQTDFQIATISTNADDGAALHGSTRIITRSTLDPTAAFLDQVHFPASRVRWVQAFAMAKQFLTTPALNSGFIRPNAALAMIAVSNGDDQSFGTVDYFARFFRGVKGQGDENYVSWSTIAGDDVVGGCQPPNETQFYGSVADRATFLTAMARDTGGVVGSICDTSFESTLVRIAQALNTLRKIFPLTLTPDAATLSVVVTAVNGTQTTIPQDAANGWTYSPLLKSIQFTGSYVPPPGSKITVQYAIASS
jgi:hypothetical protein